MRLVARWASLVLGVARFTYPVAEENYPSRRIAESLGGVIVERRETPKYMSVIYHIPNQSTLGEARQIWSSHDEVRPDPVSRHCP